MPTLSNGSSRRFPSPSEPVKRPAGSRPDMNKPAAAGEMPVGANAVKVSLGNISCAIEPRFVIIFFLMMPLYALAAFVGNDWSYMLPCTLFAALVIGTVLPLLELLSITCTCSIPQKTALTGEQEIILKAKRLPFLGLLSHLIPSGYLNAHLHLMKRTWVGARKVPAVVPLPVVLQSLSRGLDVRLRVPSLGRGVYEPDCLEIATCFPFALAWWSRRIPLKAAASESSITVLPALKEVPGNFHSRLQAPRISAGRSMKSWMLQHRSTNLKGLREFTERDSLNQIHWASSARSGKFLVREFEVETLPDFDVSLDLNALWNEKQFDLACTAAFALIHYGYRMGFTPQLYLNPPLDWEPVSEQLSDIPSGLAGEELASEILARLSPMPLELRNAYRSYEQEHRRKVTDLAADISNSPRTIISIAPQEKKNTEAVTLLEMQNKPGSSDASVSTIMQLESEAELSRL